MTTTKELICEPGECSAGLAPSTATDMPATDRRKSPPIWAIGVDGRRRGWLLAARNLLSGEFRVAIADSLRSILDADEARSASIVIDMPIGLPDAGDRACEVEARRRLGPRRSSVFTSPARRILAHASYEEANRHAKMLGRGLSRQAWAIAPKIREADAMMTPGMQEMIAEGHPELAFARLNGAPCADPKKTPAGESERRDILLRAGLRQVDAALDDLRARHPRKSDFANDDYYDACALSFTAEHRLSATAWRLGDGARDARGLRMEIWG